MAGPEYCNRRNAIVPMFARIFGQRKILKVHDAPLRDSAHAAKIDIVENANGNVAENANGRNPVVETGRQGTVALALRHAEVNIPEVRVLIEARAAARATASSPLRRRGISPITVFLRLRTGFLPRTARRDY